MKVTCILHEDQVKFFDFTPSIESYVGIFGQKKYSTTTDLSDILCTLSSTPFCMSVGRDINITEQHNLTEIVKAYFLTLHIELTGVQIERFQDFVCFFPMYKHDYIYDSPGDDLLRDLDEFLGMSLLSHSKDAIDYPEHEFSELRVVHNLVVYPSVQDNYISEELKIERKRRANSFRPRGEYITDHYHICLELCHVWGFDKVLSTKKCIYSFEGIMDLERWMEESVDRIQAGRTPLWRMYGSRKGDAQRAYEELIKTNPYLRDEEMTISQNIITIPVLSPDDVSTFINFYNNPSSESSTRKTSDRTGWNAFLEHEHGI